MKKIPTLFQRNPENRAHVLPAVTPGCEWVLAGQGQATAKVDGTCTMLDGDGRWWARREVKAGKSAPAGWVEVDSDEVTSRRVGWEPVEQSAFAKLHKVAISDPNEIFAPGTYELVGPKVNGNAHAYGTHLLYRHGEMLIFDVPTEFDALREFLLRQPPAGETGYIEGIVWWRELGNPDAGMAKIKIRDFA